MRKIQRAAQAPAAGYIREARLKGGKAGASQGWSKRRSRAGYKDRDAVAVEDEHSWEEKSGEGGEIFIHERWPDFCFSMVHGRAAARDKDAWRKIRGEEEREQRVGKFL